jgi:hypothetical protein
MQKPFVSACAVVALGLAAVALAGPKFIAVWKSPDVARLNFAGKKVAALAITDDQALQMSAEEALTRELTARGVSGIAAYRLLPREEMKDADKAKGWFERAAIDGVVALRPVRKDTEKVYTPTVWASSYYQNFWGYYGYGWSSVYVAGSSTETTTIVVETLIFNVHSGELIWAATSETKDPKQLQSFIKDLVSGAVSEMKKMKMVG